MEPTPADESRIVTFSTSRAAPQAGAKDLPQLKRAARDFLRKQGVPGVVALFQTPAGGSVGIGSLAAISSSGIALSEGTEVALRMLLAPGFFEESSDNTDAIGGFALTLARNEDAESSLASVLHCLRDSADRRALHEQVRAANGTVGGEIVPRRAGDGARGEAINTLQATGVTLASFERTLLASISGFETVLARFADKVLSTPAAIARRDSAVRVLTSLVSDCKSALALSENSLTMLDSRITGRWADASWIGRQGRDVADVAATLTAVTAVRAAAEAAFCPTVAARPDMQDAMDEDAASDDDGKHGEDGEDGENGENGENGEDGEDGQKRAKLAAADTYAARDTRDDGFGHRSKEWHAERAKGRKAVAAAVQKAAAAKAFDAAGRGDAMKRWVQAGGKAWPPIADAFRLATSRLERSLSQLQQPEPGVIDAPPHDAEGLADHARDAPVTANTGAAAATARLGLLPRRHLRRGALGPVAEFCADPTETTLAKVPPALLPGRTGTVASVPVNLSNTCWLNAAVVMLSGSGLVFDALCEHARKCERSEGRCFCKLV